MFNMANGSSLTARTPAGYPVTHSDQLVMVSGDDACPQSPPMNLGSARSP